MATLKWKNDDKQEWFVPGQKDKPASGIFLQMADSPNKVIITEKVTYNESYLKRKIKTVFQEEGRGAVNILLGFKIYTYPDRGNGLVQNQVVTLQPPTVNFLLAGVPQCPPNGNTIEYAINATFIGNVEDEQCTQGQVHNYSKFISHD